MYMQQGHACGRSASLDACADAPHAVLEHLESCMDVHSGFDEWSRGQFSYDGIPCLVGCWRTEVASDTLSRSDTKSVAMCCTMMSILGAIASTAWMQVNSPLGARSLRQKTATTTTAAARATVRLSSTIVSPLPRVLAARMRRRGSAKILCWAPSSSPRQQMGSCAEATSVLTQTACMRSYQKAQLQSCSASHKCTVHAALQHSCPCPQAQNRTQAGFRASYYHETIIAEHVHACLHNSLGRLYCSAAAPYDSDGCRLA